MAADSKFPLAAKIIFLIVIIFLLGFSIANAIYYKRIEENPNPPVNKTAAYAMFILNIVLIILCVVFGGCLCYFMVDKKQILSTNNINGNGSVEMSKSSDTHNHGGLTHLQIGSNCLSKTQHYAENTGKWSIDTSLLNECLNSSGSFSQAEIKHVDKVAKEIEMKSTMEDKKLSRSLSSLTQLRADEEQAKAVGAQLSPTLCDQLPSQVKPNCLKGIQILNEQTREALLANK